MLYSYIMHIEYIKYMIFTIFSHKRLNSTTFGVKMAGLYPLIRSGLF